MVGGRQYVAAALGSNIIAFSLPETATYNDAPAGRGSANSGGKP